MHKLLERQIQRTFGAEPPRGAPFEAFVEAVDAAYRQGDQDRELLERSLDLVSSELIERSHRLEQELKAIKRLEVELRQAEKLRAVGQLASGVAHEMNTPIQYVGDSVHFVRESVDDLLRAREAYRAVVHAFVVHANPGPALSVLRRLEEETDFDYLLEELPKAFRRIRDGVGRITDIVRAMKDFGRPDERDKVMADVNHCLLSTLTIAGSVLRGVGDVDVKLGEVPPILCFPGELNQVFLHVLVNAAQAIAERQRTEPVRGKIGLRSELEGDRIVVRISDNGSGIHESLRPRIFEPFFTTKEVGQGTGQGLAIAHSIVVDKHQGVIGFESELGHGSTFFVRIPVDSK